MPILTRRNFLELGAGSVLGLLLSPAPWKLLDDVAIWTQTWDRIPKLGRGLRTAQATACALCPAGCALRVHSAAGLPVRVTGALDAAGLPAPLCPLGPAAHQLAWHPRRLRGPALLQGDVHVDTTEDAVLAEVARAAQQALGRGERVAFLDGRPDRAVSAVYRRLAAALPQGSHVALPSSEASPSRTGALLARPGAPELGLSLQRAAVVVSFGAPLFEGHGGPGTAATLLGADGRPRIFQVEPRASATALLAHRHLPVRPGAEAEVALYLGRRLIELDRAPGAAMARDLDRYLGLTAGVDLETLAGRAGLAPEALEEVVQALAKGNAVAIGGGDPAAPLDPATEQAIAALNGLLGADRPGGALVPRRPLPVPVRGELAPTVAPEAVPSGSVGLLVVDTWAAATPVPWRRVAPMLAPGARILALHPHRVGTARRAHWILPPPVFPEGLSEVTHGPTATACAFALSRALRPAPTGAVDPVRVLHGLASRLGVKLDAPETTRDLLAARAHAIHATGRGRLRSPDGAAVTAADERSFLAALEKGARWHDDDLEVTPPGEIDLLGPESGAAEQLRTRLAEAPAAGPFLVPVASPFTCGDGALPTVLTKLFRESDRSLAPGLLTVGPDTARAAGLENGDAVVIESEAGRVRGRLAVDPDVPPGTILAGVGPDPDRLGEAGAHTGDAILDLAAAALLPRAAPVRLRRDA